VHPVGARVGERAASDDHERLRLSCDPASEVDERARGLIEVASAELHLDPAPIPVSCLEDVVDFESALTLAIVEAGCPCSLHIDPQIVGNEAFEQKAGRLEIVKLARN
jgi:hypothetical protein